MISTSDNILFEKFEIIDCLKKDDISSVYLANHIYLNKKIVLKVLDKNLISDKSIIERFKREAKLLAKLDHPNIIKVLDFGLHETSFYISFEYFVSHNLRYHINNSSLSETEVKNLLKQLLLGLEFAHRNKIIHRDIKPENIFVDENHVLKIGDFGLAFSIGDKFVTQKASVVGTPAYMSPEQVQGEELDEKSDLFSTGVVAYELITGESLFITEDLNLTINKILNYDFEEFNNKVICQDPELDKCIKSLLHHDKSGRPGNAIDALKLLGYDADDLSIENTSIKRRLVPRSGKVKAVFISLIFVLAIVLIYFYGLNNSGEISHGSIPNTILDSLKNEVVDEAEKPVNISDEATENNSELSEAKSNALNQEMVLSNDLPDANNTVTPEIISYGSLSINIIPWAYVYLDSQFIDSTPIEDSINLKVGVHEILLKNPGYPDFESNIIIKENENLSVSYSLDTLFSYLKVNVFPWGTIEVNNNIVGDTPLEKPIILKGGVHEIKISNPELGLFSKKIELKRGDTLNLTYNFSGQKFILN